MPGSSRLDANQRPPPHLLGREPDRVFAEAAEHKILSASDTQKLAEAVDFFYKIQSIQRLIGMTSYREEETPERVQETLARTIAREDADLNSFSKVKEKLISLQKQVQICFFSTIRL